MSVLSHRNDLSSQQGKLSLLGAEHIQVKVFFSLVNPLNRDLMIGGISIINNQKMSYVKGKTGFRITTEPTILGSKNETTWSGFLWYLAVPSGE